MTTTGYTAASSSGCCAMRWVASLDDLEACPFIGSLANLEDKPPREVSIASEDVSAATGNILT